MTFDLRGALLKKGEVESARLDAFAFRHRARTFRRLAAELGIEATAAARLIAGGDDEAVLAALAAATRRSRAAVDAAYLRHAATARAELIAELGDPAPHRLA